MTFHKTLFCTMKYVISNGMFVAKNTNETVEPVNVISGKITGIRVVPIEDSPEVVQLDLTEGAGDEAVTKTVQFKKYGDLGLKVLRCLFGIAEIMAGKTITLELVPREGRSALMKVSADGEALTPMGTVEPYAYDKKLITDKVLSVLMRCFNFRCDVLVFANKENAVLGTVEEIADYIRTLRRSGRQDEITVKKTGFTSISAANGYKKALADLGDVASFKVFGDEDSVNAIWEAYTEELPSDSPEDDLDNNGREREY